MWYPWSSMGCNHKEGESSVLKWKANPGFFCITMHSSQINPGQGIPCIPQCDMTLNQPLSQLGANWFLLVSSFEFCSERKPIQEYWPHYHQRNAVTKEGSFQEWIQESLQNYESWRSVPAKETIF